jgi:NADH-quinone oxidoreductase subunit N
MLVSVIDLFSIYLIIELQSLCFYILATFKTYSTFSTEAGIKYFVQGAVASGLLLLGFSIVYGASGTTNLIDIKILFTEINYNTSNYSINIFYLGLCLILISLLFKLVIFPFHM